MELNPEKLIERIFNNDYLRVAIMAYWTHGQPSAEIIFVHRHKFTLDLTGIANLEAQVLALLTVHNNGDVPLKATYFGCESVPMGDDEIAMADWRAIME